MSADGRLFGAIEAGGTKFVCAVGSSANAVAERITIPTTTPVETFSRVEEFFASISASSGPISALGVAAFGPIHIDPASPDYGALMNTPKHGWSGASFTRALAGIAPAIKVDTDVNGAGLGELKYGAGEGLTSLAYVTVGTGIGAGVIADGRPLAGIGHYELGHIRPPHDRTRDPYGGCCPFHGDCLEGLASGPAIAERWGAPAFDLPAGHPSTELEAEYLSHLALTLILGHMPERIVFGGGVMNTPGLIEALRVRTASLIGGYLQAEQFEGDLSTYIVPPALGDLAGITGAFELAREAVEDAK